MMGKPILAALLGAMALAQAAVAETQRPCLAPAEAEALTLVALPDILRETGRVCSARLPRTSPLLGGRDPLIARYQAEADRAWPSAREAIVKLSNPQADLLLQSDYARPLMTALLVPLIVGRIALDDCTVIDRFVTQMAPLPPRNAAGLIVTTLQYLRAEKSRGKNVDVPDLPLCALRR